MYKNANVEKKKNTLIEGSALKWQFSNCFGAADEKYTRMIHLQHTVHNTITTKVFIVFVFVEFDCWCCMLG